MNGRLGSDHSLEPPAATLPVGEAHGLLPLPSFLHGFDICTLLDAICMKMIDEVICSPGRRECA